MTLTERQMNELQAAVEARRQALEAELHEDLVAGAEHSDAEEADSARDLEELHALEGASARLAEGSYGRCTGCGADVGYERLRAAPHAERCIGCQQRHEAATTGSPRRQGTSGTR